jgi:hypothetical protein
VFAFFFTAAMKASGIFFLAKIYSESGFGINLYFEGWRQIGLDYHNWLIKQDSKTGDTLLSKNKQSYLQENHYNPKINTLGRLGYILISHQWIFIIGRGNNMKRKHKLQIKSNKCKSNVSSMLDVTEPEGDLKLQRKLAKKAERERKLQLRQEALELASTEGKLGNSDETEEDFGMDFFADSTASGELFSPPPERNITA